MTTATALDMTPLEVDMRLQELATQAMPHQVTLERANAAADGKKVKAPTVEEIRAAEEALTQLREQMNPLNAAYALRLWNRWYWVTSSAGGHLHLGTGCSTLYPTTELGWHVELADATPARVVELYGWHVCTVCVPAAPTLPGFRTPGTKVQEEADAAGWCLNKTPAAVSRTYYRYGNCGACGAYGVSVTQLGALRKHKHARNEAAVARQARLDDPKLIGTPAGEELRVDGEVLRTVRTAEIAYVDAMWWADFAERNGRADNAATRRADARTIAEALAAKAATTVEAAEERLAARVAKKLRG